MQKKITLMLRVIIEQKHENCWGVLQMISVFFDFRVYKAFL